MDEASKAILSSPVRAEDNLALFEYDRSAPLDIRERSRARDWGLTVIDLDYASPMGGRAPATLVVPDGDGPFAGLILQHGMGGDVPKTPPRKTLVEMAKNYARLGALVIAIDAPFARPGHQGSGSIMLNEQDRREQIQLIVDLRRAVDLLASRPDVDSGRLAYIGTSYGAAMGGLLAGVENRLKGYVLEVGDGGLVTHVTGPEDMAWWNAKPEEVRRRWLESMWPIEPIHYVGRAAPAALLFQNGTRDQSVPPADALAFQRAGSEPKIVRWYDNGHNLGDGAWQSCRDQAAWLAGIVGTARDMAIPPLVEGALTAWLVLTVLSLAGLILAMARAGKAQLGSGLPWLATTLFLGPFGLAAYLASGRLPAGEGRDPASIPPARRALGSAAWSATGTMCGVTAVIALFLQLVGRGAIGGIGIYLFVAAIIVVPILAERAFFAAARLLSRSDAGLSARFRQPALAEIVSSCLVQTAAWPLVVYATAKLIQPWTLPFGFDLLYPPLLAVLSLATLAGAALAYPYHAWMIRRGAIGWGRAEADASAPALPRFLRAALALLAPAVPIGAVTLTIALL